MNKLLTIVVPVYKVEQYINKCLDSCIIYKDGVIDEDLMNQLEVIIVNDGTPDNSAELSREYTIRYPNTFRQIDKENGGHGSAWNVGVKEATGKYLRFLDSDDWLTNLDKLIMRLSEIDVDLVFTHRNDVYIDKNEIKLQKNNAPYNTISSIKNINQFDFADHIGTTNFWLTTYKTSLLKNHHPLFMEGVRYDDCILFTLPIVVAKNYIVYDFVVYNYLLGREGQSVDKKQIRLHLEERIKTYQYAYEKVRSINPQINLPNSVLHSFTGQLLLLMDLCSKDSYKRCRLISHLIPQYAPVNYEEFRKSKIYGRYKMLPIFLFYCLQTCRRILNKLRK